jgi:hypothetical protein
MLSPCDVFLGVVDFGLCGEWVQAFWPKVVLRRWLNLRSKDSKFNAADDGGEQGMLSDQAFRFVFWCPETMPY